MRIAEIRAKPLGSTSCSSDPNERCGQGLEKIYPTTVVRYGYMKHIGEFNYAPRMKFSCGGKVVIQTRRGIEIGAQVSLTCTGCSKSISKDQMRGYAAASGEGYLDLNSGKILREATVEDLHEERRIREQAREKLSRCKQLARELDLSMKLVECEHVFGGERIVFYFMSEARVDFRELVKHLAQEYHTRIEMRQVGARDEARLVADYETCGQECCCKTFLKSLKPISMKMAKMQKATLDPSKVSGRCGRLKCCLRYEHTTYEEMERNLPRLGERVRTAHGDGVVVNRQILTQLIQVETDDRGVLTVVVEDLLGSGTTPPPMEAPAAVEEDTKPELETPKERSPEPPQAEKSPEVSTVEADKEASDGRRKRRRRRRRSRRSDEPSGPGQAGSAND